MWPKVTLEIGFASSATTPLAATSWTDVSAYLRGEPSWNHGRQFELDRIEAGTATLLLDNVDRRFEPNYSGSAYYPNVKPMKRIRLSVGENYVANPSFETDTSGWGVGTQFSIARDTTQFLCAPASIASLKSTYVSGSADSTMAFSSNFALPAAGRYAATGYVYVPSAWNGGTIQCILNVAVTEITSLRRDADLSKRDQWQRIWRVYDVDAAHLSAPILFSCASFPTGTPFVYFDCAQVASFDPNWGLADGPQPYVDAPSRRFTGYVERWPIETEKDSSEVKITAVDEFESLNAGSLIGNAKSRIANPSFEAGLDTWVVTNGVASRDVTRSLVGAASLKVNAHASLNTSIYPEGGPGAVRLGPILSGRTYCWQVGVYVPSGLGITLSNVQVGAAIGAGSGNTSPTAFDEWRYFVFLCRNGSPTDANPTVFHCFINFNETGATKYINVDAASFFDADDLDFGLDDLYPDNVSLLVGTSVDIEQFGLVDMRERQTADERIGNILDALSSNRPGERALDSCESTLSAFETNDGDPSSTAQDAAAAEGGVFFFDGSGRAVLHNRGRRQNPAIVCTFSDSGGATTFPHSGAVPSLDKDKIVNHSRVGAAGGLLAAPPLVKDDGSQTSYRVRKYGTTLELLEDSQALAFSQAAVLRYKEPTERIDQMVLEPVLNEKSKPGFLQTYLSREISDAVAVERTPPAHPGSSTVVTNNVHVEAIGEKLVDGHFLEGVWQLSPVDPSAYFQLGVAGKGLDQGVVAY
jgi:hypothetical protein